MEMIVYMIIRNIMEENKVMLNKKRERAKSDISFDSNSGIIISKEYKKFIEENKIKYSTVLVPKMEKSDKLLLKSNESLFKTYVKEKGLLTANSDCPINKKINFISKAYSFEGIKFFPIEALEKIHENNKIINSFKSDIFKYILKNSSIEVLSNRDLKKGIFIINIYVIYAYRKTLEYEKRDPKGFNVIFLFKCHDKNYDRFLKNSICVNIGSIIAKSNLNENNNCEIIKYLDLNLEVKVGIATTKNIRKGEKIKLKYN